MAKETCQIFRDPGSILVAFVLPVILIIIYAYAVSLDMNCLRIGLVIQDESSAVRALAGAFVSDPFLEVKVDTRRETFEKELMSTELRGIVVIPPDFSRKLEQGISIPPLQVIADGSEPNTAKYVSNYASGVYSNFLEQNSMLRGTGKRQDVSVESRVWYNPQLESRDFLLPGALALIMTVTGTLLTALVISREWERGTMEALLTTSVTRAELLLGKLIPYFILGMLSMIMSAAGIILVFGVPFHGSLLLLFSVGAVFMLTALGLGLLISTVARNQFVACQLALLLAFMPTLMLSGFIFEINSMPAAIQILTKIIPAKYFISCLHSLFLVGNVREILIPNVIFMALVSVLLILLTFWRTRRNLE